MRGPSLADLAGALEAAGARAMGNLVGKQTVPQAEPTTAPVDRVNKLVDTVNHRGGNDAARRRRQTLQSALYPPHRRTPGRLPRESLLPRRGQSAVRAGASPVCNRLR